MKEPAQPAHTPGLTDTERARIYESNPYSGLNHGRKVAWVEGAEYATMYERNAAPTLAAEVERLKAQVKELEAVLEHIKGLPGVKFVISTIQLKIHLD